MNKGIEQTINFDNATREDLFDIFLDARKHAEMLGGCEVNISKKEGAKFNAMDGQLTGKNLPIVPNRMIVQSWRGNVWKKNDPDSILSLTFTSVKGGSRIYMVHANTPDQFKERWDDFYWRPMKQYLKQQ